MGEDANQTSGGDGPNIEDRKEDDGPIDEEYIQNGLSPEEAASRLEKYGRNEIPEVKTSKLMVSKRYIYICIYMKECGWVWEWWCILSVCCDRIIVMIIFLFLP